MPNNQQPKINLVIGTGLLGNAIIDLLIEKGERVRSLDIVPYEKPGVDARVGDITQMADVEAAIEGVHTVYHTAALIDWNPNPSKKIYAVNVGGTENIVQACLKLGVPKLIFTSSMDVVYEGKPIVNGDERMPYPGEYLDPYSHTKSLGEKAVIAANGKENGAGVLSSCSLRTTGLYGPHDKVKFPTIIQAYKDKKMMQMGDGSARFSQLYIGNAAHAHVLAAEALTPDSKVAGQSYFLCDEPPINFFKHVDNICSPLGYVMPNRAIPYWVLMPIGTLSEWWAKLTKAKKPPTLTKYVVKATCLDFFFTHAKATQDFGYRPVFSYEQAIQLTTAWLKSAGYANTA